MSNNEGYLKLFDVSQMLHNGTERLKNVDTQHNGLQHNNKKCNIQHNDTQHYGACAVMLIVILNYADCHYVECRK